jgi:predicted dithiol-disulfide oxidoreductase (DUF899 family)
VQLPAIQSREEWLIARKSLLIKEEEAAAAHERLNEERRKLPMVEIVKNYRFDAPGGRVGLIDLFAGRSQLIMYHFMFDPEWDAGCPRCSFLVDNIGHLSHLHVRDTSFTLVSRAPLGKIEPFKTRMGWSLPWVSSFGSDFNYDFHATLDEAIAPVLYMYRDKETLLSLGMPYHTDGEQGGTSVFLRDGDRVFHTYSAYGSENELLHGTYNYLDFTPLGRGNDDVRHHDRYDV